MPLLWTLLKVRKDVSSGRSTERRPGFQELVQDIEQGNIDVVTVCKLDRLSRHVSDIYDFIGLIQENDVALVSLTENFDTTSAMGRPMLGVMVVFAQLTRETIGENVKQGLRQSAKKGKWSSGPPPFGYDLNRDTGYLEIDLEEAEVVRQIFRTYHNEAIGIRKIARRLNAQGPRTSNGNQFLYSTLQQMLTNPVYRGKTRHNEDIEVEGGQEAIIEDELFSAVQERFNNTRTLHPRRRHSKLLLAGIAKCRTCDKLLRTHHKNENDSFYRCSGNTGPHSRRGDS